MDKIITVGGGVISDKYGMWKVVSYDQPKDKHGIKQVLVRCECGTEKLVRLIGLKRGETKSCGCSNTLFKTSHGEGKNKTRLYNIWRLMRQRCYNPNASGYENYGGKGVGVDTIWSTYEAFRVWAMSNGYTDDLTIDRKNKELDYSPNNCEWVTRSENTARRNKSIIGTGKTMKSRYTEDDIENMRYMKESGSTLKEISNYYETSISHVSRLIKGEYKYTKDFEERNEGNV